MVAPHMRPWRRTPKIAVVAAAAAVVVALMPAAPVGAQTTRRVSAWLPYWDQTRGLSSFVAQSDQFAELSPFWYTITPSGGIEKAYNAEASDVITAARTAGVPLYPTIDNVFDGSRVSTMLSDATRRAAHVSAIVALATANGYAGIDIDYESLPATDRDRFSAFVRELAAALHADGRRLIVTVHPKTSEPGTWDGPKAQDYAAIGAAADLVRVMAYDYHWSTSTAGSISPSWWVDDVARFASSAIPPSKVQLGLPLYGYDWVGSTGTPLTHTDVLSLLVRTASVPQWSSTDNESWFSYRDAGGTNHTVWYSDARSTRVRLASVTRYGLAGAVFWRLGGEDPGVWAETRAAFGVASAPAADTTAPSVAILSPKPNRKLTTPTQRVDYTSSDDTGVVLVRLYLDAVVVQTSTKPIGSLTLSTSGLAKGRHLISVQALDAAGNARTANVYVWRR